MKILYTSATHIRERSHEVRIYEIDGKKFKVTYEAYNASEKCNTEIFDGYKWNHFLSMMDMAEVPDTSRYILSEEKRRLKADTLIEKAKVIAKKILS